MASTAFSAVPCNFRPVILTAVVLIAITEVVFAVIVFMVTGCFLAAPVWLGLAKLITIRG